jgi:hypothetical protein
MRRGPLLLALVLLLGHADPCTGQRIRVLLTGQIAESVNPLQSWMSTEPLIDHVSVPSRDLRGTEGGDEAMRRFIRLYFPRTYDEVRGFDFFLLNSPILYFFRNEYVKWMHDAIVEGSGGLNTASVMSQDSIIYLPWAESVLQLAFPNDAPAVVSRYQGGTSNIGAFRVRVNRGFPEPVLTPFLPLGIEDYVGYDSRIIIPRDGAGIMAWQLGNHPNVGDVPFLVGWDYGKGRTITTGDAFGHTFWSSYRGGRATDNKYAADMLMNLIFYGAQREVQTDILLFHGLRSSFVEFRDRMGILLSLTEFVERFGASSRSIQLMMVDLEAIVAGARESYLEQEFEEVEAAMSDAFEGVADAEEAAMKLKDRALLWVYVIEWLVVMGACMAAGSILFTLMVRRRLYREVRVTRSA